MSTASDDLQLTSAAANAVRPDPLRWWALALLCGAFFMVILDAAIVNVAQNPEREASPHKGTQERGVIALRNWSVRQGYPTIDVFTPFSEQDVETLIDDTLYHPTETGYQFWSDVVNNALHAADQ